MLQLREVLCQRDGYADLLERHTTLEADQAPAVVEVRPEQEPGSAVLVEIAADGLRDGSVPRADLGDVEVRHAVRPQEAGVAALELVAQFHVVDVRQWPSALQPDLDEDVLLSPGRRDATRRLEQFGDRDALCQLPLRELGARVGVGAEVGEDLPDAGDRDLGAVERPVLPLRIVEAVLP
jgi:hypothetical protein